MPNRTLLFGLGNPLLSDDAVGLVLAREVYKALATAHGLEPDGLTPKEPELGYLDLPAPEISLPGGEVVGLAEAAVAGVAALDVVCGWERVILMDSIQTIDGVPGTVLRLGKENFQDTVRTASPHDLDLFSALEFGAEHGFEVPGQVIIYAIEALDVITFHEGLGKVVAGVVPEAAKRILSEQFDVQ